MRATELVSDAVAVPDLLRGRAQVGAHALEVGQGLSDLLRHRLIVDNGVQKAISALGGRKQALKVLKATLGLSLEVLQLVQIK